MNTLIHQVEKTIVGRREEIEYQRELIAKGLRALEVAEKELEALEIDLRTLKQGIQPLSTASQSKATRKVHAS